MKLHSTLFAAILAGGVVSAQAQSWAAIGTPNNVSVGQQYWDNTSSDGAHCNVGYVLKGIAGSAGSACANQRPAGWLPYTGATPTTYLQGASGGFTPFLFASGTYTFSLLSGTSQAGGDIAAANQDWGYFDEVTGVRTSLNGGVPSTPVTMTDDWGIYILLTDGNYAYSNADNQFALFGFNSPGPVSSTDPLSADAGTAWIAGLEDIYTGHNGGSDADYQDELFRIDDDGISTPKDVTPEPGTMTLLATGLVGLAASTRRRKKA
ncbi:MAG TPA: PEP-CTERM sorting domain-containing protein [Gemmatimonadales bacterium]|jgi:hypothetical protein